jgi:hypothetical protein
MCRHFPRFCGTAAISLLILTWGTGAARAASDGNTSTAAAWVSLLLLVPGALGLWVAAAKEWLVAAREANNPGRSREKLEENTEQAVTSPEAAPAAVASQTPLENRFFIAAIAGMIWAATLALLASFATPTGTPGTDVYFFDPGLTFPLFVPIFGFIGALLYVLDLSRRGREDIPKGTEFGMRLIMGPYVAIVMVVLFGKNLGLVKLDTVIGQAALAFFSGLLVTLAFQGMIEKGQEMLGRWREKARYVPSEIAKQFDLTPDEDSLLRKAGLSRIVQLQEYPEKELIDAVRKVGFDEHLAVGFKKQVERDLLAKKIGALAREQFAKDANAKSIEDIAHLNDETLDKIAKSDGRIKMQDLVDLRDQAETILKAA